MEIFLSCCDEKLNELKIKWDEKKSISIVLCSKGYPDTYKKNLVIENIKNVKLNQNSLCFHAGTILKDNKILAVGGRVLNFVSLADSFLEARENIINNIKILNWKDGFYRKDIGFKVINE